MNPWYSGVCINITNFNGKRSWLVPRDLVPKPMPLGIPSVAV